MMRKLTQSGLVLLLLTAIFLGGYSSLQSHRLELAQQQVTEQKTTLAQQVEQISTMQEQEVRNRAMMAEQQRREQQLRQRGEIYQRKYQDAIKNDDCARSDAPGGVLDLLRGTDANAASANRPVAP